MAHGALLVHGFTAAPSCMNPLVAPLQQAGFVVHAPWLAGHNTSARDLAKCRWQDWFASVAAGYQHLQAQGCEKIFVVGISLGGLLSLQLAFENLRKKPVAALALLATPIHLHKRVHELYLPLLRKTPLRWLWRYQPKLSGAAINDPEGKPLFEGYKWMPTSSVEQIDFLQQELRPRLKEITTPALLMHATHDTVAPYDSMDYLKKNLGGPVKTVTLTRSDHVLTLDYERNQVVKEVCQFFKNAGEGFFYAARN